MNPDQILRPGAEAPLISRTTLRIVILAVVMAGMFVALFWRLWFLQVLAADRFSALARENRVRTISSEPPRGRILDRNGVVLVDNRPSLSVTLDRDLLDRPRLKRIVLKRVARLLEVPRRELKRQLNDVTVSPYRPLVLASDVSRAQVFRIQENPEDFPGIETPILPVRTYPQGISAAQVLGYVGEISGEQLASSDFNSARRGYEAGDIVGKMGLEYAYDRMLRGTPGVTRAIVNASHQVVDEEEVQEERPGRDLITSLDLGVQRSAERALRKGIRAARAAGYAAPDGGVVVLDPRTGEVRAMASFPTYDPEILSDGLTTREFDRLGHATATGDDDALLNRPIQAQVPPGSTFKVVTAGAALWSLPEVSIDSTIPCRPAETFGTGAGGVTFRNWSSSDFGLIGFARSLEISCDTFYYRLGWAMENATGAALGDGRELFQRYMRRAGFGAPTGIDLPFETGGVVPDERWLEEYCEITKDSSCRYGWLPGYSVNLSIGQGSLAVSPLQMAVTYAALVNGGKVMRPRIAAALGRPSPGGNEEVLRLFQTEVARRLPLSSRELSVLRAGLADVVMGPSGTARGAFAGFPTDRVPVAGKTGTAQIGSVDSGKNYAWFVGYAPSDEPEYLVAAYIHKAGHGGESAAPIVRRILEDIYSTTGGGPLFREGVDSSG